MAQTAIDVRTVVTVPPQDEAPDAAAPRSSFDYAARPSSGSPQPASVAPWDAPGALAAADGPTDPRSSPPTGAFTGAAAPLPCRRGAYHAIVDERTELSVGTLCALPDGSWQLIP